MQTAALPEDQKPVVDEPVRERAKPQDVQEKVAELREAAVDRDAARGIVEMWQTKGIKEPEQLRVLYRKQSSAALGRFALQRVLDLGAVYAALSACQSLSAGDDFLGRPIITFVLASVALNYGLSLVTNTISMGISLRTMYKFGTNAAAYFEAMKSIAGPVQLDAVQSTLALVDSVKVAKALEELDTFLKAEAEASECKVDGNSSRPACTIDSLAIYLTLSKARELYGFDEAELGLTQDEATDVARAFAHYDLNDDYRLSLSELQAVFADAGRDLSKEEAQAAMDALDPESAGFISFSSFARFWVDPKASAKKAAEVVRETPLEGAGTGLDAALASKSA